MLIGAASLIELGAGKEEDSLWGEPTLSLFRDIGSQSHPYSQGMGKCPISGQLPTHVHSGQAE